MGKSWDHFDAPGIVGADKNFKAGATGRAHSHGIQGVLDTEGSLAARHNFVTFMHAIMVEVLRVLKPGGHALVWAIPRTSHWTATAIEDAGFEIRDVITHHYGCLSEDTEILIDGRWEPYRNIVEGRLALCYDVENGSFSWRPIEKLYVYSYSDTAFRLSSDHTDQIVSKNHRCLVEQGGGFTFKVAETLEREENVPILEDVCGLLRAVPVPDAGASSAEHGLLEGVSRRPGDRRTTSTKTSSALLEVPSEVHAEVESGVGVGEVLLDYLRCTLARFTAWIFGTDAARRSPWTFGLVSEQSSQLPQEDEWAVESGVEGRRDRVQASRQLLGRALRALSTFVLVDGSPRWVRDGTSFARGAGVGAVFDAQGNCASSEPQARRQPPTKLDAVRQQQGAQVVRAPRHTSSDLVRVVPVHYEGKVWCVQVPTGAFVARRNGKAFVTGNSGFPKSLNVSKAIDKAAGAEREITGLRPDAAKLNKSVQESPGGRKTGPRDPNVTLPASVESARWEGFGTSLKPASEHWILARKPLGGTVAANVLAHGTGAINIDGCRIHSGPSNGGAISGGTALGQGSGWNAHDNRTTEIDRTMAAGRWPANLVLSHHPDCRVVGTATVKGDARAAASTSPGTRPGGFVDTGAENGDERPNGALHGDAEVEVYECVEGCPVAELDQQSGISKDGVAVQRNGGGQRIRNIVYAGSKGLTRDDATYGGSGGASRFFYVAKAPKVERFSYLTCDCEGSNVPAWANEVRARSEAMGVTSRRKATSEETSEDVSACSTSSCGNKSTAPCPQDTASITSTRTSKTTASRTCISSPIVPTNVSMEDANCATECGSSRVESVASSSQSTPTTSTCLPKDGPFTGVVAPATVASSVKKTTCVACGSEVRETAHPTVKPLGLMRWLVRLIGGQPGSVILDPFAGSGSTLVAALLEGFTVVGIDQEPEYVEIARRRIEWWLAHPEGK
jgi:hypothetical protein